MRHRPDGSGQKIGALVLFSIGILLFLCSLVVETQSYAGKIKPDGVLWWWGFVAFSALSLTIGFMLLISGWIIHAIYFLPSSGELDPLLPLQSVMEHAEPPKPDAENVEPSDDSVARVLLIFSASIIGVLFLILILFKIASQ